MTTAVGLPLTLYAGKATTVAAAEWPSPNQTGYIAIANNSPVNLQVNTANGTSWLYANTVDIFEPGNNAVQVLPQGNQPLGSVLGCVTPTWYSSDEIKPTGYPLQLVQFPGGASLIAAGNPVGIPLSGFDATQYGFIIPSGGSLNVLIPAGTGQVQFWAGVLPASIVLLTITGTQSGHVYYEQTVDSPGTSIAVPIPQLYGDTSLTFAASAEMAISQLFAIVGLPIPTAPNLSTGSQTIGNGGQVLPALSSGAYYIWGIDANTPAADTVVVTDAIIDFYTAVLTPNGNQNASTPNLAGHRTPGPVTYGGLHVNQAANINVRYALGP